MKKLILSISLILMVAGCSSSKYLTSSYDKLAPDHKTIALLPFYNTYTGKIPKELSKEKLDALKKEDAYFFQHSLYGQLLEESGTKKGDIYIDIQDISRTNKILADQGVQVPALQEMDVTTLSAMLGVDAVVRVNLRKDFLLSDKESVMVDVAGHIYRDVVKGPLGWKTWGLAKTGEIYINASIIDGGEGLAVWNLTKETSTDWQRPMDKVVAGINNHISKKFPYRKEN